MVMNLNLRLKPRELQFCFCPLTKLNFHPGAKPEPRERIDFWRKRKCFKSISHRSSSWTGMTPQNGFRGPSENGPNMNLGQNDDKFVVREVEGAHHKWPRKTKEKKESQEKPRQVKGAHRAIPSTTSDIGSVRTERKATPVATNMKTFPSHLSTMIIGEPLPEQRIILLPSIPDKLLQHHSEDQPP